MRTIAEVLATHPIAWGGGSRAPAVDRQLLADGRVQLSAGKADVVFEKMRPGALFIRVSGLDTGQFETAVLDEIRAELLGGPSVELFVDARAWVVSAKVSKDWTYFFYANREHLERVNVLVGPGTLELTIAMEQNRPRSDDLIQVHADADLFDAIVAAARTQPSPS